MNDSGGLRGPEDIVAIIILETKSVLVVFAAVVLKVQAPTVENEIISLTFVTQWPRTEGVLQDCT